MKKRNLLLLSILASGTILSGLAYANDPNVVVNLNVLKKLENQPAYNPAPYQPIPAPAYNPAPMPMQGQMYDASVEQSANQAYFNNQPKVQVNKSGSSGDSWFGDLFSFGSDEEVQVTNEAPRRPAMQPIAAYQPNLNTYVPSPAPYVAPMPSYQPQPYSSVTPVKLKPKQPVAKRPAKPLRQTAKAVAVAPTPAPIPKKEIASTMVLPPALPPVMKDPAVKIPEPPKMVELPAANIPPIPAAPALHANPIKPPALPVASITPPPPPPANMIKFPAAEGLAPKPPTMPQVPKLAPSMPQLPAAPQIAMKAPEIKLPEPPKVAIEPPKLPEAKLPEPPKIPEVPKINPPLVIAPADKSPIVIGDKDEKLEQMKKLFQTPVPSTATPAPAPAVNSAPLPSTGSIIIPPKPPVITPPSLPPLPGVAANNANLEKPVARELPSLNNLFEPKPSAASVPAANSAPAKESVVIASAPVIAPAAPAASSSSSVSIPYTEAEVDIPLAESMKIDGVIQKMNADPSLIVTVVAYASGSPEQSSQAKRTALARSLEIRKYLMQRNIGSERIIIHPLGNKATSGVPDRVDFELGTAKKS